MHRYAVLSDVNGNFEALSAVLDDIKRQGVDDIIFLGDSVGYGPDPVNCLSLLRRRARVYLCGRFENLMIREREWELSDSERRMLAWTRDEVCATDDWDWLCARPEVYRDEGIMAVPVNPRGSGYECLLLENIKCGATSASPLFLLFSRVLFVGGNHKPWILMEGATGRTEKEVGFECNVSNKVIVSVGSVGQPRDYDPRPCYVIASDELVIWRRVEYDIERTVKQIEANEWLDPQYAVRLREGI
jgi:hypothetical protein